MPEHIIIKLFTTKADLEALKKGINIDSLRLAKGVDGNYEFRITYTGECPLPDHHAKPLIPLEPGD